MENMLVFWHRCLEALPLRSVVSFSGPDQSFIWHTTQLHANRAKFSIAVLIRRVVAQAVLRPDFGGHTSKRSARILKTIGDEVSAATVFSQIVHLLARQIVKIAADLHSLKRSHSTKIHKVFSLCARVKNEAIPL